MPNYKEMYITLFSETSKAIAILQEAQRQTEELFVNSADDTALLQIVPAADSGNPFTLQKILHRADALFRIKARRPQP